MELRLTLEVALLLPALHLVERGLRNEEVARFDDVGHLPVEERQQQRSDMRALHIGVRHDDDLVVAQFRQIELIANAGAERGDKRADLCAREHLVDARPLHVQDLAAQRQSGLETSLARLRGAAAGRVALDKKDFRLRRIALLAIGELAGQGRHIQRAFAPCQLAGLAGRFAGGRGLHDLLHDVARFARVLLEPLRQPLGHDALHHGAYFRGDELVFRLAGKLGVGNLHRQHAGETFARIVARQRHLLFFCDAGFGRVCVDGTGERRAEAREMRAAVALGDVVREAHHVLVVAVVPPQRRFDGDAVLRLLHHDRLGDQRVFRPVEELHERAQAAFVVHLLCLRLDPTQVGEVDANA